MSRHSALWLLLSFSLLWHGHAAEEPAPDAEETLAAYQSALSGYNAALNKNLSDTMMKRRSTLKEGGIAPEDFDARRRWFIARHPGTDIAARVDADRITELFDAGQWDHFAEAAAEVIDRYPHFALIRARILYLLVRVVNRADAPEEARRACFDALLERAANAPAMLAMTGNYLNGNAALSRAEKYALAAKGAAIAGASARSRDFEWRFLSAFAGESPAEARPLLEAFLKRFPEGSMAAREAREQLLEARKAEEPEAVGDELKELRRESQQVRAEVKRLQAGAEAAAEAGDAAGLEAAISALGAQPLWALESPWWGKIVLQSGDRFPIPLLEEIVKVVPPGVTGDELTSALLRRKEFYADPAGVSLLLGAIERHADDIQRHGAVLHSRLGAMRSVLADPAESLKAHRRAAVIARKLKMDDAAAGFLFEAGKRVVISDRTAGSAMLREAATLAPGSEASVNAAWLVALLEGKLHVIAPLTARSRIPGEGSEPPKIELPKETAQNDAGAVVEKEGTYSLKPQATETDPLQWERRFGSTSRSREEWEPERLPASLLVPLEQASTLKRLKLRFSAPAKFTVSLLDGAGKVLSRQARDWPFWDSHDLQIVWPGPDETLEWPPVAAVRYVRVDLYDAMSDRPALRGMEAEVTSFAAEGRLPLRPQSLPADAKSLKVSWNAELPGRETSVEIASPHALPYPIVRWYRPWTRKTMRDNLGVEFRGEEATLVLSGGPGGMRWSLDGEESRYEQPENVGRKAGKEIPLKIHHPGARQRLRLSREWVSGRAVTTFEALRVKGKALAGVEIRTRRGGNWGQWQGPYFSEVELPLPDGAGEVQARIVLDARPVQADATPVLDKLTLTPSASGVAAAPVAAPLDVTFLPENLAEVADDLRKFRMTVVYPKAGTRAEYELARSIAGEAQAHLISDDVGLNLNNDYYGPVISVGTPRTHRFARQLLAMAGVWDDPAFLNSVEGRVAKVPDVDGNLYYFVTGDTPEAVRNAGKRLLAALPPKTETREPFRLFTSNTLEVVYPWRSGMEAPGLEEFAIRLGVNDRRSGQFGLHANRPLADLKVETGVLTGRDGGTLPAPEVRTVGGYEWIPFFGDLRLPNFLIPEPLLPVPARTSVGYWITAKSTAKTRPGLYRGTLKVTAEGFTREIPLTVRVDPFALNDFARIDTYSYASVPWWYTEGTPEFDRATRELAGNEAAKRVSVVAPLLRFDWKIADNITPVRYAIAPPDTAAQALQWKRYDAEPKEAKAGEALFIEFAQGISPSEISGGFISSAPLRLTPFPKAAGGGVSGPPLSEKEWTLVRIPASGQPMKGAVIRSESGGPFTAGRIRAFTDRSQPLVKFDFTRTLRQMDLFEAAYRDAGLSLPSFRLHVSSVLAQMITGPVFGVGHWHYGGGGIATDFVAQFKEQLKTAGRDERTILKVSDEPKTLTQWAEAARPYKEGGLRVMTAHYSGRPDVKDAVGIMNPWCPNYEHDLSDAVIRQRQKAGDKVWWYQCGVPATRLTGKPVDNLPIYWLTAKWHLDGVANYAALGAKESGPEGSSIPYRYDHGMGFRMNFLPDGRLIDTPRRELEAEGIRDYMLIECIRDAIARLRSAGQADTAARLETALDETISSVVVGIRGYPTTAAPWLKARERLYEIATEASELK